MPSNDAAPCHGAPGPSAEVLTEIEALWRESGKPRAEFRILDWGCGSGHYVAHLRRLGYPAFGVDISAEALARAEDRLRTDGTWDPKALQRLAGDNRTALPAQSIDCVFSFQVLEHVEHLESVVREIGRITAPGGLGLHVFPARWRPLEVHLRMPLVHWLPKNGLRQAAILLCLLLGARPRWGNPLPASMLERARIFHEYSCRNTYYRPLATVLRGFAATGLQPRFAVLDHPGAKRLAKVVPAPLLEWLVVNFWSVRIRTVLRDR